MQRDGKCVKWYVISRIQTVSNSIQQLVQSYDKKVTRRKLVKNKIEGGNYRLRETKESACHAGDQVPIPGLGRPPGRGCGNTHSNIFAWRNSHEQRSLAGYRPWGTKNWTRLSNWPRRETYQQISMCEPFFISFWTEMKDIWYYRIILYFGRSVIMLLWLFIF